MKLHNDLSYLGFEIESPISLPNPENNHTTQQPQVYTSAPSSIMSNWVRRSFSIKGLKPSKRTNKNASTTTVANNSIKTSDEAPQSIHVHQLHTENDSANQFSTPEHLPIWNKYKKTPVQTSFQFEVNAPDVNSAPLCISRQPSWSSEVESPKTPDLTPDRSQIYDAQTTPNFSWNDTIGILPHLKPNTLGIRRPPLSPTLNIRKRLAIVEAPVLNPYTADFEDTESYTKREAIMLWSSGVRPNTPQQPFSRPQSLAFHERSGSDDTICTADLTPKPLRIRPHCTPSSSQHTVLYLTPPQRQESLGFETPRRSPIQESLMPKPLSIRKARPASITSSVYEEAYHEASIYGANSFDESNGVNNLRYYQEFFNNRPLMRCLDTSDEEDLANNMYSRLLEETKHPESFRGELEVRQFWNNVRAQLREDFEEIKNSLPSEDEAMPAWSSGQRDKIDELLEGYGPARSPMENFLLSCPTWASPWAKK